MNNFSYKLFRRPRGQENTHPCWVAQILEANGIHPADIQECAEGKVIITFNDDHPVPGDVYARLEKAFREVNQPIQVYQDTECGFYPESVCFKLLGRAH